MSDNAAKSVAEFESKLQAEFEGALDHVSASVGDIKRAALLLFRHITGDDPALPDNEAISNPSDQSRELTVIDGGLVGVDHEAEHEHAPEPAA
jgi:hypothetical protein